MVALLVVHGLLPTALLIAIGLAGVGGAVWGGRGRRATGALAATLRTLQITVSLQALLGLVLWIAAGFALSMLWHVVVGSVAAVAANGLPTLVTTPGWRPRTFLPAGAALLFGLVLVATLNAPPTGGTEAERAALLAEVEPFLTAGDAVLGAELYRSHCLACHGPQGAALALADAGLGELAVTAGETFLTATAFGASGMPGLRDVLRSKDYADLLTFARTLAADAAP